MIGSLLAGGLLAWAAGLVWAWRRPRLWLATLLAGAGAGLTAALCVLTGGGPWRWAGRVPLAGQLPRFELDAVSALFLALVCGVGAVGAVYGQEYWSEAERPESAGRGRRWWSGLLLGMGLVVTLANGLHFLVAWEWFALCGFFLVRLERERAEARQAAWLYLGASHAGTLLLVAFFGLLAARTGGWELGPWRDRPELGGLFWLALLGFGLKAGFFPLHVWLPAAHAGAPSHVSAVMSGVAIKMGVYGIVRFSGWLPVPPGAAVTMVTLGAIGAVTGMALGMVQNDLKRLLAYCSVENVGVILAGLGGALLAASSGGAAWGRLAAAGALWHVWNHGLFKALLFLGAGSVLHATGTRQMSRLGGLWRNMPWTAAGFAVGTLAVAGLPPLNGWVSEWLIYSAWLEAAGRHEGSVWVALPALTLLGMAGALALAGFIKAAGTVFLGLPRSAAAREAHESGRGMLGAMAVLAAFCAGLAWAPTAVWPVMAGVVECWHPGWRGAGTPDALVELGKWQVGLGVLLAAGGGAWWGWMRRRGWRRAVTWDCGYAAPTTRMQYSSGSFGGWVGAGLRWACGVERQVRRPRGVFPESARWLERTPEPVLERLVQPIGRGLAGASAWVRRLQHGRLQWYVVYVLVGLGALVLLVWEGGGP
jgi:hydrogenase-4 component B